MTEKTVKKALAGETISNGETIAESSDKPFYNNFFLTIQRDGAWVDRIQLPAVARIGRDADNQIRIANRLVSRHHCILRWSDGAWHVTDLNSANGTYVNGDKITSSQVNVGDAVSLGECQFRIEVTEQSDPVENHDSHPTVSELTRSVVEVEKVAVARVFQESEFAASRSGDSSTYAGLYNLAVQLGRSQDAATHANIGDGVNRPERVVEAARVIAKHVVGVSWAVDTHADGGDAGIGETLGKASSEAPATRLERNVDAFVRKVRDDVVHTWV